MTEFGIVPESWDVVSLGELVEFTTGKLDSNAAVEGGKYHSLHVLKKIFESITTLLMKKQYFFRVIMRKQYTGKYYKGSLTHIKGHM